MMQQELVEKRRWISPHRFLHALNYCMVLPGPEAQQLATYMGWLLHGPWGGVLSGLLFILPSLLIMSALGALYISFGQVPEVQGMLYGLKPAVLAIVMAACIRLGQKVLHGTLWWSIALGALVLLSLGASFVFVIGMAALVGWLAHLFSRTPLPGLPIAATRHMPPSHQSACPTSLMTTPHRPPMPMQMPNTCSRPWPQVWRSGRFATGSSRSTLRAHSRRWRPSLRRLRS